MNNNNFQVQAIQDKEELIKVILFLKSAFKWSSKKALKIYNALIFNNKNIKVYGYSLKDKNKNLLGGLLIFDQENNLNLKVINMSSWYVDQKMRGYGALKMIKTFVNDYSEYIITNVSSNSIAYKILKAFKFKDSKTINRKFIFFSIFRNLNIFDIYKFLYINKVNIFRRNSINFEKPKSYYQKIYIENSSFSIITKPTIWEKKICFFYIRINGFRILSTSNTKNLSKYFYHIFLLNFINNFSLFATTHCDLNISDKHLLSTSKQIYLTPKDNQYKEIECALGSELYFL